MNELSRLSSLYNKDYTTTTVINLLMENPNAKLSFVEAATCNYWKLIFPDGKTHKLHLDNPKKIKYAKWKSFKHYIKIKMAVLPIFSNYKKIFNKSLNKILFAKVEKEEPHFLSNKRDEVALKLHQDQTDTASVEHPKEQTAEEVNAKILREKEILIKDFKLKKESLETSLVQIKELENDIYQLEENIIDVEESIIELKNAANQSETFTHQSKNMPVGLFENMTELEEFELILNENDHAKEPRHSTVEKEKLIDELKKSKKEKKLQLKQILLFHHQEHVEKLKTALKLEIDDIDLKLKIMEESSLKKPSLFSDDSDLEEEAAHPSTKESLNDEIDSFNEKEPLTEHLENGSVDLHEFDRSITFSNSLPASSRKENLLEPQKIFDYLKHNLDKIVFKFSTKKYLNLAPATLKKELENLIVNFDKIKHPYPSNTLFCDTKESNNTIEKLVSIFQSVSLVDLANMEQRTLKGLIFGTIESKSDFEDAFLTYYATIKENILEKCRQALIENETTFPTISSITLLPFKSVYISKIFIKKTLNSYLKNTILQHIKSNHQFSKLPKKIDQAINFYIKSLSKLAEFFVDYVFDKHPNILSYLKYISIYNDFCSTTVKQKKLVECNTLSLNEALTQIEDKIDELLFMILSDLRNELISSLKHHPFEKKIIETTSALLKNFVKPENNDFFDDEDSVHFRLDGAKDMLLNQFVWPFLMEILT